MKKKYLSGLFALFFLAGCESLEDTYSDYTGDGPIRYVGMCTDPEVVSGWERLTVTWKNSLDPNVEKIRIACKADEYEYDTIVPYDDTRCEIRGLSDASYAVTVEAVNREGNTSLSEVVYGRPYTYTHEVVMSFTRGVLKHFFVKNNIVMFLGNWDTNILLFTLKYTDMDGQPQDYKLDEAAFREKYLLIRDVDVSKPVVLERRGMISGCPDVIDFKPYIFGNDPILLSDFKLALRERYGETQFSADFLNGQTELEFDYDLVSLEDVLYFPNLEKVVLGKNRYLGIVSATRSAITEKDKSLFCLDIARELLGAKIECYGSNYFMTGTQGITDMGDARLPEDLTLLSTDGWSVESSPAVSGFDERDLLDDDPKTLWEPLTHGGTQRTFELTIDMKKQQSVNGLKIVQADVTNQAKNFLPFSIIVRVSEDNINWNNPTYVEDNTLGATLGETTLLRFAQPHTARYIRVTVKDRLYNTSMGTILGDVMVF